MDWDQDRRAGIAGYALANMDALQNWFFWTWRIGNSTEAGYPTSPMWHYRLGLQEGWMPKDPRVAGGYCGSVLQVGGNQVCRGEAHLTQYSTVPPPRVPRLPLHPLASPFRPRLINGRQQHPGSVSWLQD